MKYQLDVKLCVLLKVIYEISLFSNRNKVFHVDFMNNF